MAITSRKPKRGMGDLFKKLAVVAALSACTLAQAGVLDFEGPPLDSPFIATGTQNQFGKYWVQSYGGTQAGDTVGSIIDGADNGLCFGIVCPLNNPSNYYAGLDDGYFYFGLNDDSNFKVRSLQASFIGAGQAYAATSGLLVLQGYNFANAAVGSALQIGLNGPNTAGAFNFSSYDLSGTTFGNTYFSYVRVLGYACDGTNPCSRAAGLSNFGIDNIVTVPEPTTWALFGLGLIGLGVFSRRRSA
jgi:hypothetical protein